LFEISGGISIGFILGLLFRSQGALKIKAIDHLHGTLLDAQYSVSLVDLLTNLDHPATISPPAFFNEKETGDLVIRATGTIHITPAVTRFWVTITHQASCSITWKLTLLVNIRVAETLSQGLDQNAVFFWAHLVNELNPPVQKFNLFAFMGAHCA
jgi:hypothetical protein